MILDNCDIGRRAKIQRAILDKNVRIPEGATIGYDLDQDRKYHTVTDNGIVVILDNRVLTKNYGQAFLRALPGDGLAAIPVTQHLLARKIAVLRDHCEIFNVSEIHVYQPY